MNSPMPPLDPAERALRAEGRVAELEAALKAALSAHAGRTRDFHHGVKNSLQVMQSYLALSRRQRLPERNIALAEAEAKVMVIAGAYRMALGDGALNPLPLRAFLKEVVEPALALLQSAHQGVALVCEADLPLPIDTAILLALAMVEAVLASVVAQGSPIVDVSDTPTELWVRISVAETTAPVLLPARLMAGLKSQLRAQDEPLQTGDILRWRLPAMAAS